MATQSQRLKQSPDHETYSLNSDFAEMAFEILSRNSILRSGVEFYRDRMTSAGRWFLFPTFLFGLVGSVSLEHQLHVACLFSLAVWLVAFVWMLAHLPKGVTINARYPARVAAGEVVLVRAEVVNGSKRPHYDVQFLPHLWPKGLNAHFWEIAPASRVGPGETVEQFMPVECPQRGMYVLPGFRVSSSFPFGLLCATTVVEAPHSLLVYPKFTPLSSMEIQPGRKYHPGGVALASNLGDSFEYIGNREYREGDNIRDLDWNATARVGRPIIREYRQEYFHRVAVILDTYVPPRRREDYLSAFENAVSLTAAIGDYMAQQEYLVDIFAAGPTLYHLTAGRSLAYLDQILDILACVKDTPIEPFEALEEAVVDNLAQITTIICVFLDWTPARREFVRRIGFDGAAIKVIISRNQATSSPIDADPALGVIPVIDDALFAARLSEL